MPVIQTADAGNKNENFTLKLVASYTLFGNVESLASVRLPNSNKDALIMSFRDAKAIPPSHTINKSSLFLIHDHAQISVVEFNVEANDIRVVSLHYFEDYKFSARTFWISSHEMITLSLIPLFSGRARVLPYASNSIYGHTQPMCCDAHIQSVCF